MIKVLMVCAGNICRSPMAEAVFQNKVNEAGLGDEIRVDSAGIGSWHAGETAHSGTLRVLKEHGISYNGRARQITRADLSTFDYVLAMDTENMSGIERLAASGKSSAQIRMFLDFAHNAGTVRTLEVPDPYYNGKFEVVYELVNKGSDALLQHIRDQHRL